MWTLIVLVSFQYSHAQLSTSFNNISKLEASNQMKAYKSSLGQPNASFTNNNQKFLLNDGLPQLFVDGNKLNRRSVRQRLKTSFFDSIKSNKAHEVAIDASIEQLTASARDKSLPINGRVNAILFLGELTNTQNQPIEKAVQQLSDFARDDSVTPAIRIAALTSICNISRAFQGKLSQRNISILLSAFDTAIKLHSNSLPPVGRDWMQSRALEFSDTLATTTGNNNEIFAAIIKGAEDILEDKSRSIDLRIRVIVFFQSIGSQGIKIPILKVLSEADNLVLESLQEAYNQIREKSFESSMAGLVDMGSGGSGNSNSQFLPMSFLLRMSWRLIRLADSMEKISSRDEAARDQFISSLDIDADADEKPRTLFKNRIKKIRGHGERFVGLPSGDFIILAAVKDLDPNLIEPDLPTPKSNLPQTDSSGTTNRTNDTESNTEAKKERYEPFDL